MPDDDELVRRACDRISESIFHVKIEPKSKSDLQDYIEKLITKLPNDMKAEWRKKMNEQLDTVEETSTGFVVGENRNNLFILTCAHSFEVCFSECSPISLTAVRNLFKFQVRCDHEESNYHNQTVPRVYTDAEVYKLDARKDMLLLRVNKKGLCTQNHMVLEMADNLPPRRLGRVGMVSWPYDRHRTTVKGTMSHNLRGQLDIYDTNPHGYNFSGIEVNVTSEAGSSGAPLIDLASRVIGLLHGGRVDCMTYFVSLGDITAKITSWGIIKKAGSASLGTGAGSSSSSMKRSADASP